jgi:hypothetical protein
MKQILLFFVLAFAISLCGLSERLTGNRSGQPNSNSAGTASSGGASEPAERASPTSAQVATLEGGQTVTWEQQGISFSFPKGWSKMEGTKTTFNYRSPSMADAAFLGVNISPMDKGFPTDISIKAFYDQAVNRRARGEVTEVRWLEIDGLRGVEFLESPPETADGIRRLQWQAYRTYQGQIQMVNIILSTQGQYFDRHQDALYGILYSMKLAH